MGRSILDAARLAASSYGCDEQRSSGVMLTEARQQSGASFVRQIKQTDKKQAWTGRSTLQPAGGRRYSVGPPWVGNAGGRLKRWSLAQRSQRPLLFHSIQSTNPGCPRPGSPRTGLCPWGGAPALGTGETANPKGVSTAEDRSYRITSNFSQGRLQTGQRSCSSALSDV